MSEEDEELWDQRQRARPVDFVFVKYKMFMFKYIKIGSKEQELLWVDFYV